MKEEKENLSFWESVETTPEGITKPIEKGKFKLTAIDAYHQIKNATEKWGMYGSKWGLKVLDITPIEEGLLMAQAVFFYPFKDDFEGSFPVASATKIWQTNKRGEKWLDDDCVKKVITDMLTKALSMLGFNADVFLGTFDGNKYVGEQTQVTPMGVPHPPAPPSNKKDLELKPEPKEESEGHTYWCDMEVDDRTTRDFKDWLWEKKPEWRKKTKPEEEYPQAIDFFKLVALTAFSEEAFANWLEEATSKEFRGTDGQMVKPQGIRSLTGVKSLGHLSVLYGKLLNKMKELGTEVGEF